MTLLVMVDVIDRTGLMGRWRAGARGSSVAFGGLVRNEHPTVVCVVLFPALA